MITRLHPRQNLLKWKCAYLLCIIWWIGIVVWRSRVQAPSRHVPTLTFQACMLVLLRESCTVSWLNAKEIPIHKKQFSGNTSHSLCTPLGKALKPLYFIKLQFSAQTKSYIKLTYNSWITYNLSTSSILISFYRCLRSLFVF